MGLDKVCEMIDTVNNEMREHGFSPDIHYKGDYIDFSGKEVIIKMPFVCTITLPREKLAGNNDEVSRAISQAISQAVSVEKRG